VALLLGDTELHEKDGRHDEADDEGQGNEHG
jgi:hypothetical protein